MNSVIGGLVGETQGGSIGIGFAIPVDQARRITSELIATGSASHAWLGAQMSSESDSRGARIVDVTTGGPAAAAGLDNGALVTQLDVQVIRRSDALVAAVQSQAPGARVTVGFIDPSVVRGRRGDPRQRSGPAIRMFVRTPPLFMFWL
jgi:putative serine protease PepD